MTTENAQEVFQERDAANSSRTVLGALEALAPRDGNCLPPSRNEHRLDSSMAIRASCGQEPLGAHRDAGVLSMASMLGDAYR